MHDVPRQKLRELILQYGRSLCDDPRLCKGLLKDHCGQYKREIFVLVSALQNRVVDDLINTSPDVPPSLVLGRLIQQLIDELGLAENAARWAVESWALALGMPVVNIEQPRPALEQPSAEWLSKKGEPPRAPIAPSAPPLSPPQTVKVVRDRLRDGSDGPELVVIPAGEFWMGSPNDEPERYGGSERRHRVKIEKRFLIGRHAVTFKEYDGFCAATGRPRSDDNRWGRGSRPAINVSWNDAVAYAEWLSTQTGQMYRLPVEAEWEYAARAGTETAFWWGNYISTDDANYNGKSYAGGREGVFRKKTVPVDEFNPNPWGLYQVHGNVWEWTGSCYRQNYNGMELRYAGKDEDGERALRGGSFNDKPGWLRSAYRSKLDPATSLDSTGFRLARSL